MVATLLNEPVANRLLAALPADEYERLRPLVQPVEFSLGEVVYEFGGALDYVFFPTNSIISLLYTMENGTSAEMGLTGNEGGRYCPFHGRGHHAQSSRGTKRRRCAQNESKSAAG